MTTVTITQLEPENRAHWRSRRIWWKPWTWLRAPMYVGPVRHDLSYTPIARGDGPVAV